MLDPVISVSKKNYPGILLEEYKYEIKKNKIENLINDGLELCSYDDESVNETENQTESDNESYNK